MARSALHLLTVTVLAGVFIVGPAALAVDTEPVPVLPIELVVAPPTTVIVAKGDHLWKISARHLNAASSEAVTNAEIHPYWRKVIDRNLPALRSGDADLIFPGEIIEMPETG